MRSAETVLGVIKGHWRAAVRSKDSSPVRRGAVGKGLREMHLAGRLPYCLHGSAGGGWKRAQPVSCQARAGQAHEPRHKTYLASRLPNTLVSASRAE